MKNRAVLSLMEQILMVLVFAVAAAICLRVFTVADRMSKDAASVDAAYLLAQNAAEEIKNTRGAPLAESGCEREENGLLLKAEPVETGNRFLGGATVTVFDGEKILCELPVRWQK